MIRSGSRDDRSILDRRRLNAGLVAVGLGGCGLVPSASAAQGLDPGSIATPDAPSPEALRANLFTRMSVQGRVNGAGPYEFVIDTGATRTAVSEEVAAALALPEGPKALVHGVTSAQTARTVHIERLDVAGRSFHQMEPCVFPRAVLAADGLLGLDALSGFHLELDVTRRSVSLTPSGPDRVTFGRLVPSRLNGVEFARSRKGRFGQLILLNARVEGVETDCFVDSGAQYSIGNPALFDAVAERQSRLTALNPIRVFGVTGQVLEATPAVVSRLDINRLRLGPTRLLFADLHAFGALGLDQGPALLIGADLLSRFSRVSLDFGLSRMNFGQLRRAPVQG
ncbi:MAG: retroviral-like aspartic protease family protein [Brevundimonas sp.]|uniref:retroviral-like aspartic protease family protein n=1 Tax=Brevundimonas sp. TaxID=1871086 RepID=UPI004034EE49